MKTIITTIIFIATIYLFFSGCEKNGPLAGEPDQIPPELSLVGFIDSTIQLVHGTVTITAEAYDSIGINKIDFFIDNALMFMDTSEPYVYEWDTGEHSNCEMHTIICDKI